MRYIDLNGIHVFKETLENTEGAIKKGQSRETDSTGYTRRRSVFFYALEEFFSYQCLSIRE
jgi:hypothetical protein